LSLACAAMAKALSGCWFGRADDGWEAELEWLAGWQRQTTNKNGTSGWVTVLSVSEDCKAPGVEVGGKLKVHLCANNPCTARHSDSKHGGFPPEHFQKIAELTPKPVVEESCSSGSDLPLQMPLRPGSAAPANQDATLSRVDAFGPKFGLDRHAHPPAQIEADILGRVLSLAREIRTPRKYVGYSFFVLFALAYTCRPSIWEGSSCVDLIATFAPWALEKCKESCAVQAVCVCYEEGEEGVEARRMIPVSEEHPLSEVKHFLSAMHLPGPVQSDADNIEAYYHKLAVAVLGTVADGDCGVDCCCQMMSLPQTTTQRQALREAA
jgi:hypothetical protein